MIVSLLYRNSKMKDKKKRRQSEELQIERQYTTIGQEKMRKKKELYKINIHIHTKKVLSNQLDLVTDVLVYFSI